MMPTERYYLDHSFHLHQETTIEGAEFHHLTHVMRTRKGDLIELVNGRGALAQARVHDLTRNKALLYIEQLIQEQEQPPRLILAQAFAKPNRLDFIFEKGTELGVDSFWLFPGQLSAKKEMFPQQLERGHHITIAAMKQCGRLTLPSIILKPPLDQWSPLTSYSIFFGDLSSDAPLFEKIWKNLPLPRYPILFITGPESGFHPDEIQVMKNQGIEGVKLHNNILRTDTASLMALSLLSHWLSQYET